MRCLQDGRRSACMRHVCAFSNMRQARHAILRLAAPSCAHRRWQSRARRCRSAPWRTPAPARPGWALLPVWRLRQRRRAWSALSVELRRQHLQTTTALGSAGPVSATSPEPATNTAAHPADICLWLTCRTVVPVHAASARWRGQARVWLQPRGLVGRWDATPVLQAPRAGRTGRHGSLAEVPGRESSHSRLCSLSRRRELYALAGSAGKSLCILRIRLPTFEPSPVIR